MENKTHKILKGKRKKEDEEEEIKIRMKENSCNKPVMKEIKKKRK